MIPSVGLDERVIDLRDGAWPSPSVDDAPAAPGRRGSRLLAWLAAHRRSGLVMAVLLALTAAVQGINMSVVPQRIDDEGTYVAQAWAVEHLGQLGHYTYWYDHPPLGWLQMAVWTWGTAAFERAPNAVAAGREVMLVAQLVSVVLLWVLARRLALPRWAAALAVVVFSLSPLAVQFHRTVYLDNVATPWLLGAFVLALSPRQRLAAYAGAGLCFAVAVLTKETTLLLAPAVVWALWRSSPAATRRYVLAVAGSLFALAGGFYVLMALIKGELMPGADHVSLFEGVTFQLRDRASSGSIFDAAALGNRTVSIWLSLDTVSIVAALVCSIVALVALPRMRPVALAFVLLAVTMLRPGYLPVPFVIAMVPFGALCIAAVASWAWSWRRSADPTATVPSAAASAPGRRGRLAVLLAAPLVPVVLVAGLGAVALGAPTWVARNRGLLLADLDRPMRQAEDWVVANVGVGERIITDDAIWVDLVERRFPADDVVWYYKVDTDPAVSARVPQGWRGYQYLVATESVRTFPDAFPEVSAALDNSVVVASFGQGVDLVEVRRIVPEGIDVAQAARAAGVLARQVAGAALATNPGLEAPADVADALRAGELDSRAQSLLAALAPQHRLTLAAVPWVPGEEGAGGVRRVVEVAAVDGVAVDPADPGTRAVIAWADGQDAGFRPAGVEVGPPSDGTGPDVLRLTYPVDATP